MKVCKKLSPCQFKGSEKKLHSQRVKDSFVDGTDCQSVIDFEDEQPISIAYKDNCNDVNDLDKDSFVDKIIIKFKLNLIELNNLTLKKVGQNHGAQFSQ